MEGKIAKRRRNGHRYVHGWSPRAKVRTFVRVELGVLRVGAIKRQGESQRWDKAMAEGLQGSPQQPDPRRPGLRIPIELSFAEQLNIELESITPSKNEDVPR